MWQRIQTLYLSIAIIINLLLFFLNIAFVNVVDTTIPFDLYGLRNVDTGVLISTSYILPILVTLSIILSFFVISLYKKRQLQIKLGQLNLFLQVIVVVAFFFVIDNVVNSEYSKVEALIEYSIGTYITVIPILFIYLSIKAVKKDEALVRAADRIR